MSGRGGRVAGAGSAHILGCNFRWNIPWAWAVRMGQRVGLRQVESPYMAKNSSRVWLLRVAFVDVVVCLAAEGVKRERGPCHPGWEEQRGDEERF